MLRAFAALQRRARALRSDRRGVSAIEFAVGAPVLIVMLLGGVDATRAALAARRLERVAATVGQMVSVNTTGTMTTADLQFYEDSAFATFPQVLADSKRLNVAWNTDLAITVSSVAFATVAGVTVATVNWSKGPKRRACGINLTIVPDTAAPSPTTLPTDSVGTGTLLVVDVVFTFTPTIATRLIPPITIARSYYVPPRYVRAILLTNAGLVPLPDLNLC